MQEGKGPAGSFHVRLLWIPGEHVMWSHSLLHVVCEVVLCRLTWENSTFLKPSQGTY